MLIHTHAVRSVSLNQLGILGERCELSEPWIPLLRFVVDLLYNNMYDKSTTKVHNKSTANRSNGVRA